MVGGDYLQKIKNPLRKRYSKELKEDFGKYLVIFLFITLTIAFVSGFLVADNSMKTAYDQSFNKYNVEDGNFELSSEITSELNNNLESKENIDIYKNWYLEKSVLSDETLRIFSNRLQINLPSIHKGNLPDKNGEIAIDRLYAANNKLNVGDTISIQGKDYTVSGLIALSDYSALFKSNSDFMFDANKFGVAVVSEDEFEYLADDSIHYNYSWLNNETYNSDKAKKEHSDDIQKIIAENASLKGFIPREDNQSIKFAGNDMGSDKAMFITLLYIVIVIMAFVFAVTIGNTVESESSVIGTLRASGYTKKEILLHYITLPIIVSLVASVIGNILGYTFFKNLIAGMYYNSYSLPIYKTLWNANAFIMTTVLPCLVMIIINIFVLIKRLALSPLKFLRHDFTKKPKKGVIKLPEFKFIKRFQIRVILQNKSGYLIMFIGIFFANILLLFGMMMSPLLSNYKQDIVDNMICKYQYILKAPIESKNTNAEKYALTSLKSHLDRTEKDDDVTVYGIQADSDYFKEMNLSSNETGAYVSDGYMEKHELKIGDTITLKDNYDNEKTYDVKIVGSYHYPSNLAVFMNINQFNKMFNNDPNYFSGYFSNESLTDIDKEYVASCIKEDDLTNMVKQLQTSMGDTFYLVCGFAVILYMMLIYLLSKIVIEKNRSSISMVKILGYNDREVNYIYLISIAIIVGASVIVSIPLSYLVVKKIYFQMMSSFAGWLPLYIKPSIYIEMFFVGIISYAIIALLHIRKINKIPMEEALKNAE